jgi:hypothetical protein
MHTGNEFRLTISTFRGADPDATHYYGRIRSSVYGETDVERYATSNTIRLDSEKEVIREARRWFREHARTGDFMTLEGKLLCRKLGRTRMTGKKKPRATIAAKSAMRSESK